MSAHDSSEASTTSFDTGGTGLLYQSRGETAKAQDASARLGRLWRRADAKLQPVLSDARVPQEADDR